MEFANQNPDTLEGLKTQLSSEQEKLKKLTEVLESNYFFANQPQFNATLFNGFKIILGRLTTIEQQLEKLTVIDGQQVNLTTQDVLKQ